MFLIVKMLLAIQMRIIVLACSDFGMNFGRGCEKYVINQFSPFKKSLHSQIDKNKYLLLISALFFFFVLSDIQGFFFKQLTNSNYLTTKQLYYWSFAHFYIMGTDEIMRIISLLSLFLLSRFIYPFIIRWWSIWW